MISYNEPPPPPEQPTPPPVEPPKDSNKANKGRLGNILVATTFVLIFLVWIPTFAVGALGVEAFNDWTYRALDTAFAYTVETYNYDLKPWERNWDNDPNYERPGPTLEYEWKQGFAVQGIFMWACITGLVVAAQYFVTGGVRLRFKKETEQ